MNRLKEVLKKHSIGTKALEEITEAILEGLNKGEVELIQKTYPLGYFKPEIGQNYFNRAVEMYIWDGDHCDHIGLALGSVFETGEQAQHEFDQRSAYGKYVQLVHEINEREGWVCDWENIGQDKGFFEYDCRMNEIDEESTGRYRRYGTECHFCPDSSDEIIETLGVDAIKLALWGMK